MVVSISTYAMSLEPFKAEFTALRHGRDLGSATLQLAETGEQSFRLTYHSKVSLFFLSDERKEISDFKVIENRLVPQHYHYERSGTGSDKELRATFDSENGRVVLKKKEDLTWQGELDNQLYRLDAQLKLASGKTEFEYDLINYRGEKRHYAIKVLGKEQLELPYGSLEAIKVKISRESKRRETFAWFSPSLNYQLVRLQQFKDGKEQGDIQLTHFEMDQASASQQLLSND